MPISIGFEWNQIVITLKTQSEGVEHPTLVRLNSNLGLFLHLLRAVPAQLVISYAVILFGVMKSVPPSNFLYIQNLGVAIFFFLSGYFSKLKMATREYKFDEFLSTARFDYMPCLFRLLILIIACDPST